MIKADLTPATPFFNVDRVPLYADHNGSKLLLQKEALVNHDTGVVYGVVSPKYKLVENDKIADIFTEAFKNHPVESINDHVNNDGGKWKRDIVFGGKYQKEVKVGDVVSTKITLHNSYDGLASVGFDFGTMRLVCTNGMKSYHKDYSVTFKHVVHDIVEKIRKIFEMKFEDFSTQFEMFKKLTQVNFTEKQFMDFVRANIKEDRELEEHEQRGIISERQASKIIELYPQVRQRYNDHEDTVWSHLNVLTAIQTHHTKAHNGSNVFSAGHRNMQTLIDRFNKQTQYALAA